LDFIDLLLGGSNQFLSGALVIGGLGLLVAGLRLLPGMIWHVILRVWSVSVTIRDQFLLLWIGVWIEQSDYGKRNRWLDAKVNHVSDGVEAVFAPGFGTHTFWLRGTRVWLHYELEDQGMAGKKGVLAIRTLGRDDNVARSIITEAVNLANLEQKDRVPVFINDEHGYWYRLNSAAKRFSDSVFLNGNLMETILGDAHHFMRSRDWYMERGIPHRRGYLLYGPPGNGKSTIVRVLAAELSLPIYALVLSIPELSDNTLAAGMSRLPENCILVIEDFEKVTLDVAGVSTAGLLNAIDGPLATEGRILVMTANAIDAILPSMLRAGRIDQRWHIDYPNDETIARYANHFFPDGGPVASFSLLGEASPWTMAEVQHALLETAGPQPEQPPEDKEARPH